ncbi:hypothetical protein FWD20_03655 [Candidatus Saccharibacteria bacterium]|nr:hypothetical protein [Candidatus Saccharibacteria bacterium]
MKQEKLPFAVEKVDIHWWWVCHVTRGIIGITKRGELVLADNDAVVFDRAALTNVKIKQRGLWLDYSVSIKMNDHKHSVRFYPQWALLVGYSITYLIGGIPLFWLREYLMDIYGERLGANVAFLLFVALVLIGFITMMLIIGRVTKSVRKNFFETVEKYSKKKKPAVKNKPRENR